MMDIHAIQQLRFAPSVPKEVVGERRNEDSLVGYKAPLEAYHDTEDEESMIKIFANDSAVSSLYVRFRDLDHDPNGVIKVGRAFRNNTHLRKLEIVDYSDVDEEDPQSQPPPPYGLPSFFMGLAGNRSIEHLKLYGFNHSYLNIFTTLRPFFQHNSNLRGIEITRANMPKKLKVPSLISAIASTSKLEFIDVSYNCIGDKKIANLIYAITNLSGLNHLLELHAGGNMIRRKACTAMRTLLRHPANKLEALYLDINHIDDVCIDILFGGLVDHQSMKLINLDRQPCVTAAGWGVFFDMFANSVCSLERILMRQNSVGDDGAISLGKSLAAGKCRMKLLHLTNSASTTQRGWWGLSVGLRSPNCPLLILDLSRCIIDDAGATAMASALVENTSLFQLIMNDIPSISAAGWRECFRLLSNWASPLKKLTLNSNNIDDVGVARLVAILVEMRTILYISLCGMTEISTQGWRVFVDMLEHGSASKLKYLHLGHDRENSMDDDVVIRFADALASNVHLETLWFQAYTISDLGLSALVNALCDKSSIDATFGSNHVLHDMVYNGRAYGCPVGSLLSMNRNPNKAGVARKKILSNHFGNTDSAMHFYGPMAKSSIVPTAVSWICQDRDGFSAMYHFLQQMPWLLKSAINNESSHDCA